MGCDRNNFTSTMGLWPTCDGRILALSINRTLPKAALFCFISTSNIEVEEKVRMAKYGSEYQCFENDPCHASDND